MLSRKASTFVLKPASWGAGTPVGLIGRRTGPLVAILKEREYLHTNQLVNFKTRLAILVFLYTHC